jgi:aldose 1-epimerase
MSLITISSGDTHLTLAPGLGGTIARYWQAVRGGVFEWFRPASPASLGSINPEAMSLFPLVPYSGLIRQGSFTHDSRRIVLPLNWLPAQHTIHGHGWQAPWHLVETDGSRARVEYRHAADAWPWAYRAEQSYRLDRNRLRIEMTVTNEGDAPMPAGLGPHPYFVRTPRAKITAQADKVWLADSENLPTELVTPSPFYDLRSGLMPSQQAIDHVFAGWDRRAVIEWPEWQARLTMTAEAPLDFLVVYTPPDQDYFCVEPVSNTTDAFNGFAAGRTDTGTRVLAPGETLKVAAEFQPEV